MQEQEYMEKIRQSTEYISAHLSGSVHIALVLGSGLGELADELSDSVCFNYSDIPHFPVSTVAGHAGRLVCGKLEGIPVLAMQGRFHYYEGYALQQVTFPIRVFCSLGIENIVLTNAAGGINKGFAPGDLMVITDHINLSMRNPLHGKNLDEFGPRFPDMSAVYDRALTQRLEEIYKELGIRFVSGTYSYFTGPSYETPAEIRLMGSLGADAVGMSTVPEAIVARHCGMRICGISCITNMAAGILDQPLDHSEVMATSMMAKDKFKSVIRALVKEF